jgi:transaldolase
MKLFVDTGNVKEIEALASLGIIDGVTTNPSLLAKEKGDYRQTLKEICRIVQVRSAPRSSPPTTKAWSARGATWPASTSTSW